jgi:hypothetical protein
LAAEASTSGAGKPEEGDMSGRSRLFDDLAGVAGGAVSALSGLRGEAESVARARFEELVQRLHLVRQEELDAAMTLAANARAGQEAAEARLSAVENRLSGIERRLAALESGEIEEPAEPE